MIRVLSKAQKIAIIILAPLSLWLIYGTAQKIDVGVKWADAIIDLVLFFGVPFVLVRASIPVVAFFEVLFKSKR